MSEIPTPTPENDGALSVVEAANKDENKCPGCGAPDQTGYYCVSCGYEIVPLESSGQLTEAEEAEKLELQEKYRVATTEVCDAMDEMMGLCHEIIGLQEANTPEAEVAPKIEDLKKLVYYMYKRDADGLWVEDSALSKDDRIKRSAWGRVALYSGAPKHDEYVVASIIASGETVGVATEAVIAAAARLDTAISEPNSTESLYNFQTGGRQAVAKGSANAQLLSYVGANRGWGKYLEQQHRKIGVIDERLATTETQQALVDMFWERHERPVPELGKFYDYATTVNMLYYDSMALMYGLPDHARLPGNEAANPLYRLHHELDVVSDAAMSWWNSGHGFEIPKAASRLKNLLGVTGECANSLREYIFAEKFPNDLAARADRREGEVYIVCNNGDVYSENGVFEMHSPDATIQYVFDLDGKLVARDGKVPAKTHDAVEQPPVVTEEQDLVDSSVREEPSVPAVSLNPDIAARVEARAKYQPLSGEELAKFNTYEDKQNLPNAEAASEFAVLAERYYAHLDDGEMQELRDTVPPYLASRDKFNVEKLRWEVINRIAGELKFKVGGGHEAVSIPRSLSRRLDEPSAAIPVPPAAPLQPERTDGPEVATPVVGEAAEKLEVDRVPLHNHAEENAEAERAGTEVLDTKAAPESESDPELEVKLEGAFKEASRLYEEADKEVVSALDPEVHQPEKLKELRELTGNDSEDLEKRNLDNDVKAYQHLITLFNMHPKGVPEGMVLGNDWPEQGFTGVGLLENIISDKLIPEKMIVKKDGKFNFVSKGFIRGDTRNDAIKVLQAEMNKLQAVIALKQEIRAAGEDIAVKIIEGQKHILSEYSKSLDPALGISAEVNANNDTAMRCTMAMGIAYEILLAGESAQTSYAQIRDALIDISRTIVVPGTDPIDGRPGKYLQSCYIFTDMALKSQVAKRLKPEYRILS